MMTSSITPCCAAAPLPVLAKGILHPGDAARAVAAGAAGVVVSNHGGRVLDGLPASVEALPAVASALAGRAPVLVRGASPGDVAWGYAGPDGALVVPPRFARAEAFSEGLACVRDAAGRAGYITLSGEWAIPPMWLEEAGAFSGGRAHVKLNEHWGYIDRDGRFVIPPRYLRAQPFSEGLAATAVATPDSPGRSR